MNRYKVSKNFELETHKYSLKNSSGKTSSNMNYFVLAKYAGVGYYLVTPFILGVLLGFGLDSLFNSKPFFILFFIIIGFISSIYNLYRLIKEEEERVKNVTRQHQS